MIDTSAFYVVPMDQTQESKNFLIKSIKNLKPRYLFLTELKRPNAQLSQGERYIKDKLEFGVIEPYDIKYDTEVVKALKADVYNQPYLDLLSIALKYQVHIFSYLGKDEPYRWDDTKTFTQNASIFQNYEADLYHVIGSLLRKSITGPIIMTIDVLHLRSFKSYRYPGALQIPKLFEGKIKRYRNRVGVPTILNPKLIKNLDKKIRKDNYELEQDDSQDYPFKKGSIRMPREHVWSPGER